MIRATLYRVALICIIIMAVIEGSSAMLGSRVATFLGQSPLAVFSAASLWNQRVSPSAIYTTISWPVSTGSNYGVTWAQTGFPVYIASPSDPVVLVTCPTAWGWTANPSLHIPIGADGAYPPPPGNDSPIIVIDNNVAWNFWQFVRNSNTTATAQSQGRASVLTDTGFGNISGLGAGISAAGSSELGGLLVQAQTDTGPINHALQMAADNSLLNTSYVSPAIATDGQNIGAPLSEGMLLAIPPGTSMPGGLSPLGQKIFVALQQYGCYITERGGTQTVLRAQQNAYDSTIMNAAFVDMQTVLRLLKIVS